MLMSDQTQLFLTTLKSIRSDYTLLRDKAVYRDERDSLDGRIVALQRRIDDGRISRRLPAREEQEFQASLDSIRSEYLRMTESGRYSTYEERSDISRRLDLLETDLNRYR